MKVASLGSGSRGNATLVAAQECCVLVDCGFSLRELKRRAAAHRVDLSALRAILVTHEHSDHVSGVTALARHYKVPVYLTHGTLASGRLEGRFERVLFNADEEFEIGPLRIHAVAVPHDAREPVQYCFASDGHRAGVLTDLGSITPHVSRAFASCDLLVLEFNHDRQMLAHGPYPPALKRRVGGDWGHLSNSQALELLQAIDRRRLQHVVIAHTSEKNNSRDCVEQLIAAQLPELSEKLLWASQDAGFAWIELGASAARTAQHAVAPLASGKPLGAY